jgi:hypothetical protein
LQLLCTTSAPIKDLSTSISVPLHHSILAPQHLSTPPSPGALTISVSWFCAKYLPIRLKACVLVPKRGNCPFIYRSAPYMDGYPFMYGAEPMHVWAHPIMFSCFFGVWWCQGDFEIFKSYLSSLSFLSFQSPIIMSSADTSLSNHK